MPIRPEMKKRYPKDWKLRSKFIRKIRARGRCERCGVRNHAVGQSIDGKFVPLRGNWFMDLAGEGLKTNLEPIGYARARSLADDFNNMMWADLEPKHIVIVLTCAHVFDHRPENASFLNLMALCQRCHNRHDQKMRIAHRRNNSCQLALEL